MKKDRTVVVLTEHSKYCWYKDDPKNNFWVFRRAFYGNIYGNENIRRRDYEFLEFKCNCPNCSSRIAVNTRGELQKLILSKLTK